MERERARELLVEWDNVTPSLGSREQRTTIGLILEQQIPEPNHAAAFVDQEDTPLIGVVSEQTLYLVRAIDGTETLHPGAECLTIPLTRDRSGVTLAQHWAADAAPSVIHRRWHFDLGGFVLKLATVELHGEAAPVAQAFAAGLAAATR